MVSHQISLTKWIFYEYEYEYASDAYDYVRTIRQVRVIQYLSQTAVLSLLYTLKDKVNVIFLDLISDSVHLGSCLLR